LFAIDLLANKRGKAGPAVEGLNLAVVNAFGKQIVN